MESADDVCWICLDEASSGKPLVSPCKCPRKVGGVLPFIFGFGRALFHRGSLRPRLMCLSYHTLICEAAGPPDDVFMRCALAGSWQRCGTQVSTPHRRLAAGKIVARPPVHCIQTPAASLSGVAGARYADRQTSTDVALARRLCTFRARAAPAVPHGLASFPHSLLCLLPPAGARAAAHAHRSLLTFA